MRAVESIGLLAQSGCIRSVPDGQIAGCCGRSCFLPMPVCLCPWLLGGDASQDTPLLQGGEVAVALMLFRLLPWTGRPRRRTQSRLVKVNDYNLGWWYLELKMASHGMGRRGYLIIISAWRGKNVSLKMLMLSTLPVVT